MDILTFKITENERFEIYREDKKSKICSCYFTNIALHYKRREYFIGKSGASDLMRDLIRYIKPALENKFRLDPSIQKNIGYYWNQN